MMRGQNQHEWDVSKKIALMMKLIDETLIDVSSSTSKFVASTGEDGCCCCCARVWVQRVREQAIDITHNNRLLI
jgi:hypothetical protein